MTSEGAEPKTGKLRKTVVSLAAGGVVGFIGAFSLGQLFKTDTFAQIGVSAELAALVGLIYVLTTLAVVVGLISPNFGARFLNVEDGDELREQRAMLTWSAAGMLALGVALIVAAFAAPLGPVPETAAVIAVVLLVAIGWFAGMRMNRYTDELMREVSKSTCALAFYLLFLIGGGWSLLAHVNWVAAPNPIDWLTMFAAFILLATFIEAGRRGMLTPR